MKSSVIRFIGGFGLIALWVARWQGVLAWSWPIMILVTAVWAATVAKLQGSSPTIPPGSQEAVVEAFRQASPQRLRCLTFPLPPHWRVEKIRSGAFRMYIKELNELAWIMADVDWLWETNIDSVNAYKEYAPEFAKGLKVRLVRNEITERWGAEAHEFEFTGKHSTGWKVTIPYHATEYGMQVSAKFAMHYREAKSYFEEFLARTELAPPALERHSTLQGTLSIGLPSGFRSVEDREDGVVWKAVDRRTITVSVQRLQLPREAPLTDELLRARATDRPNLGSPFEARPFAMKDLGLSGFMSFQATGPGAGSRDWFVAALEMVTGGRYLFVFDADTPTTDDTFYMDYFRHVPMSMEIIASMREEGAG